MKRLRDLLEMVLEMTQTNMLLITSVQYKTRYHRALCTILTIPRWSDFFKCSIPDLWNTFNKCTQNVIVLL